jgi:ABC-type nitrate/sulfonate/bicarbonate transport system permease component
MTLTVANPTLAAEISDNDAKAVAARSFAGRIAKMLLSATVSILVVAGIWWLFLMVFQVDAFVGRTPANILGAMTTGPDAAENREMLFNSFGITLRDAFFGLAAGMIVATICAVSFNLLRSIEHTVMPVAMVLQSVPLVALTPLLALLFGRGLLTTTIIAGIVTFFPALVNVNLALRNAPASSMDLMRAYGANTATTLKKVQIPCATPAIFASLRIAAPLALIGALLAEWLATAEGLGYLMLQSMVNFNYDLLWAAGALVTFFSIVLYNIISSIEGAVLARYAPEHLAMTKAR